MIEKIECSDCKEYFLPRYVEEHHISYDPPTKIPLCRKCHQKRHTIETIEGELTLIMRQYNALVKTSTGLKNRASAWEKDFSLFEIPLYNEFLNSIKKEQKILLREAELTLNNYNELCEKWKGIGIVIIAQLLAFANPKRFPSLRKFLYYCGKKEVARKNKKYSRIASTTAFQTAESLIRCKNEKYRAIYDEIKKSLQEKYKKDENKAGFKAKIHGMTLNRVSTLWLKEFYYVINNK